MNEPVRILLQAPVYPKHVDEPRIKFGTVSDLRKQLLEREPPELDYWATAFMHGLTSFDVLFDAIDASNGKSILVIPLRGYEWINEVSDIPRDVLALLPGIGVGVLLVVPSEYRPRLSRIHDSYARDELANFADKNAEIRVISSSEPFADPLHRFLLPLLVPDASDEQFFCYFDNAWLNEIQDSSPRGTSIKAGILQMNSLLDDSHSYAQSMEGHRDADYWHAIMHRREPDYGNSKYWFRRVGRHPVFRNLARRAAQILSDAPAGIAAEWAKKLITDSGWDSFAFVNMCQQAAADEDSDLGLTARRIQWIEMLLLLNHCARPA